VAQTNGNITLYDGGTRTWTAGTLDNQLDPGESLRPGWFLSNRRGDKLVMRRTGNATLTTAAGQVWASGTAGHPGAALTMRRTGDLVLAAPGARVPLWTSATSGHPGARLIDQRSGVLAVRGQGHVLWTSRRAPVATLTLGQWPGRAGPRAAARYYGYPYSDPPACTDGGACHADQWAFYQGQCTSWVAYQLNQKDGLAFTNSFGGQGRWGNAVNWAARARKLGVTVNDTPTAGSVAWYAATKAAPDGHVAFVERVTSGSAIVISEMNYDGDNGFWVHALTKTTGDWPTAFIHLARA
jgi:surface antigen